MSDLSRSLMVSVGDVVKQDAKLKTGDHVLAVGKAALSLFPITGAVASLISDYVPSSAQRAQAKFVEQLNEKLKELQERIDVEGVNKENFAELYAACEALARRTNRDEKLRAAANLLANLLLKDGDPAKCSYEELDHFLQCIDKLSIGAISVLGAARQVQITSGQVVSAQSDRAFNFRELAQKFPTLDGNLVMSLASELRAFHLVYISEGLINAPNYESYSVRVTAIGGRLAKTFIEGQM